MGLMGIILKLHLFSLGVKKFMTSAKFYGVARLGLGIVVIEAST